LNILSKPQYIEKDKSIAFCLPLPKKMRGGPCVGVPWSLAKGWKRVIDLPLSSFVRTYSMQAKAKRGSFMTHSHFFLDLT
jgi:hypothetical protein